LVTRARIVTDSIASTRRTPLAAALARPQAIAIACVVALAGLGWGALGIMAATSGPTGSSTAVSLWALLCAPAGGTASDALDLLLGFLMWSAMVLAMMLPTAGPMILAYADIGETAARKGEPVVSPLLLVAGYVAAWLGFALAAALAQSAFMRPVLMHPVASTFLPGALFLAAGLYQLSALKHACLARCQRPFAFFFANWTTRPRGVFRLGLRQGLYCLGCCFAMMLLMLAAGAMNIVWMAALGIVMTAEKMTTTPRVSRAVGAGFIAIGVALVVVSLNE
jgi:predicted metal-binding membrane protein